MKFMSYASASSSPRLENRRMIRTLLYRYIEIVIVVLALHPKDSSSFVAFDCSDPGNNVTHISLSSIGLCDNERSKSNITQEEAMIKVFQLQDFSKVNVYSCLIEAQHIITRCGKTIDTRYNGGFYSEVIHIGKEACLRLHQTSSLDGKLFNYPIKFEGLRANNKNIRSGVTHGYIDQSGSCQEGVPLDINGRFFDRPIRESIFTITYQKTEGTVDQVTGRIFLKGGNYGVFSEGECFTPHLGNSFWNDLIEEKICRKEPPVTLLYSGLSVKTTNYNSKDLNLLYSFTSGDTDYALAVKEHKEYCNYIDILQTEHPRIFIIEGKSKSQLDTITKRTSGNEVDLLTHLNSKLLYVLRHVKGQLDNLYQIITEERCRSETQVLRQLQTLALISPNQFAYDYFGKPGHTAFVSGEVIYVMKCKAVSVTYRPTFPTCYQELPVIYNNDSYYVQPRTQLLSKVGTPFHCNPLYRPYYKLGVNWFSPTHNSLIRTAAPVELNPSSGREWHFDLPADVVNSGLYSKEVIEEYRKSLEIPDSEQVILSNLASNVIDRDLEGNVILSMSHAITDSDINSIKSRMFQTYLETGWEWVSKLGCFSAGVWVLLWFVKLIYSIIINVLIVRNNEIHPKYYLLTPWGRIINYALSQKHKDLHSRVHHTELQLETLRDNEII